MLSKKDETEWSEDEKRAALEYEKKVKYTAELSMKFRERFVEILSTLLLCYQVQELLKV